jgi:hypothetical protein
MAVVAVLVSEAGRIRRCTCPGHVNCSLLLTGMSLSRKGCAAGQVSFVFDRRRAEVTIEWPPFQADDRLLDHPATEEDIAAGRAAFVLRDANGHLAGSPVPMGMPRLGFAGEGRRLGIAGEVEATGERIVVGVRHADGTFSICSAREFDSAPRFLFLYHEPGFGLDDLHRVLAGDRGRKLTLARRDGALAVRWQKGPALFIRHAVGPVASQEAVLLGNDNPHAEGLSRCDALFEVSFLDLDDVLDESISLPEVQWALADELAWGFEYLGWNDTLTAIG